MSELPQYVSQCDVCSHPARAEIDSLLLQRSLAEKKGETGSSFNEITLEATKIIEDKFPNAKRVTEVSIRNHYHNHELAPGMNPVSIDYDQNLIRVGSLVLPLRDWIDGVRIIWSIAFWNLTQNPSLLGPSHFIKLTQLLKDLGGGAEDELIAKMRELLQAGPGEKAIGAFLPPDVKRRRKPKNNSGD